MNKTIFISTVVQTLFNILVDSPQGRRSMPKASASFLSFFDTCTLTHIHVHCISFLIIYCSYMKKILDSDCLRALQFRFNTSANKCNTRQESAKRLIQVQITHQNSGL